MEQKRKTPQIKICGITRKEEADFLNEAKADYAGFVFFEKSKRNISFEAAGEIFPLLEKEIKKVAVFVSPTLEEIKKAEEIGIDIIQVHGTMRQEICKKSRHPIWRAYNIKNNFGEEKQSLKQLFCEDFNEESGISGIVIDGAEYGSGKTFDWDLLQKLPSTEKQVLLAGGLNPDNVGEALTACAGKIDGVDTSSGVERTDGNGKSKERIEAFVRAVRGRSEK